MTHPTPDPRKAALDEFPSGMNYQGKYTWDWFNKHSTTIHSSLTTPAPDTTKPPADVRAALNALFRLENDALASRDGYGYSGGDAEQIRRIISQFAKLTAADTVSVTELEQILGAAAMACATTKDIIENANTQAGAATTLAYNRGIARAIDLIRAGALSIIDRKGK